MVKKNRRGGDSGFSLPGEDHRRRQGTSDRRRRCGQALKVHGVLASAKVEKILRSEPSAPAGEGSPPAAANPWLARWMAFRRLLKKNCQAGTSRKNRRPKRPVKILGDPTLSAPSAAEKSIKNTGQRSEVLVDSARFLHKVLASCGVALCRTVSPMGWRPAGEASHVRSRAGGRDASQAVLHKLPAVESRLSALLIDLTQRDPAGQGTLLGQGYWPRPVYGKAFLSLSLGRASIPRSP
ncbi:hypothetical protein GDO81_026955 [Engystomops pustulosus]|uniref:Uncharacterized protein n=1 Tax=Engystomops pustulosus TaxID=76066 RepID=A0AAV6Z4R2_ENGPU|nr:hypothetical protein GDO81_026955 [Engystomops pustulosus]